MHALPPTAALANPSVGMQKKGKKLHESYLPSPLLQLHIQTVTDMNMTGSINANITQSSSSTTPEAQASYFAMAAFPSSADLGNS